MAKNMNYTNIQVQSDCMLAVQDLKKTQVSLSEWHSPFLDIMELESEFNLCGFNFINRRANVLADNVAKVKCELGSCRIWRNCLPGICNPDSIST